MLALKYNPTNTFKVHLVTIYRQVYQLVPLILKIVGAKIRSKTRKTINYLLTPVQQLIFLIARGRGKSLLQAREALTILTPILIYEQGGIGRRVE